MKLFGDRLNRDMSMAMPSVEVTATSTTASAAAAPAGCQHIWAKCRG